MLKFLNKIYFKSINLLRNESGETNIVALILILAVIVALFILFSDKLTEMFNKIWGSLFEDSSDVI